MVATIVLYLAPGLAVLALIAWGLVNRSKSRRLAQTADALQAANTAAQDRIARRQALDADLETLHERHRKEELYAQTPRPDRDDFDNDWLPEPRAGSSTDSGTAAPAGSSGAAGNYKR
jgi:type II secretory pathway pseudopilin PulG